MPKYSKLKVRELDVMQIPFNTMLKILTLLDTLAPASRQSIVSAVKDLSANGPADSADENVDIDIISTSPVVGSPVISAPAALNDGDNEEDLDIDGDDIDVGQENMETTAAVTGQDSNGSSLKDVKALSTKEPAKLPCKKNWMRAYLKQVENVDTANESSSPSKLTRKSLKSVQKLTALLSDEDSSSTRLPSEKKEDIENVEVERESKPEPSIQVDAVKKEEQVDQTGKLDVDSSDSTSIKVEKSETVIIAPPATSASQQPSANGPSGPSIQMEAPSQLPNTEDIDEGEMSDASSASTIPLDDLSYQGPSAKAESAPKEPADMQVDEDSNTKDSEEKTEKPEEATTQQEAAANSKQPAASASDAEQSKPTKVKLSLQEYLSRRAAGQSVANDSAGERQQKPNENKEPSINGPDSSKLSETTA